MTAQSAPRLVVSDHALVRWMERTGAVDATAMKDLVATSLSRAWAAARSMSQSEFLILVDGLVFVVRNDTVITVHSDDGRYRHQLTPLALREKMGPDE